MHCSEECGRCLPHGDYMGEHEGFRAAGPPPVSYILDGLWLARALAGRCISSGW